MVDSLSGIGVQSYQQSGAQTFQPGKNVESRDEQRRVQQDDATSVKQSDFVSDAVTSRVEGVESAGEIESAGNEQTRRGSLVNITV